MGAYLRVNPSDGLILGSMTTPQDLPITERLVAVPEDYQHGYHTHCISGVLSADPTIVAADQMRDIRNQRNAKLFGSDWTQLADAPLTTNQKTAWETYRQALRDFPATCDPANPVWPTVPA